MLVADEGIGLGTGNPAVGREGDGFFAGGDAGVPVIEFEMGPAEQVVGFRGGSGAELLFEDLHRLIDASSGEKSFRLFGRIHNRQE